MTSSILTDIKKKNKTRLAVFYSPVFLSILLIFLVSFGLFYAHAAPSVTFHDSGELAMAAASGGIPHPPGSPTYVLLTYLFLNIFKFNDPARGTNLFSAFSGALTLSLLAWVVIIWTGRLFPRVSGWVRVLSGWIFTLIIMQGSGFLEQSTTTEQYTLMTAFIAVILCTATFLGFPVDRRVMEKRSRSELWAVWFCLGLFWGLAIGNHLSQISLGFFLAVLIWLVPVKHAAWITRIKRAVSVLGGLIGGLLVYLWVPLRSRVNPLLDFSDVETLGRLYRFVSRSYYHTRTWAQVPRGFITEWIKSYDLSGQLGTVGLCLAGAGIVIFMLKFRKSLLILFCVAVPYAAGMLLAHMRQTSMDIFYIREYGVLDWHLPLYIVLGITAAVGFAFIADILKHTKMPAALGFSVLCVLLLLFGAYQNVHTHSLKSFKTPRDYIDDLWASVPEGAILLLNSDDSFFMLSYDHYIKRNRPDCAILSNMPSIGRFISSVEDTGNGWNEQGKADYFNFIVHKPENHILNGDTVRNITLPEPPILTEYDPNYSSMAKYLLPSGLLFELSVKPVSDEDILAAENAWQKKAAYLYKKSPPITHRLYREAMCYVHFFRAWFFTKREMWPQAEVSARLALNWMEDKADTWHLFGFIEEKMGKINEAVSAYKTAIKYNPYITGPRYNLGVLYARGGFYREAEQYFLDVLKLAPDHKGAKLYLSAIQSSKGR